MHSNIRLLHRRDPPLLRRDRKIRSIPKSARGNRPTQASKHGPRSRNVTHLSKANSAIQEHSQRYESSEPEQHGKRIEGNEAPSEAGGRKQVAKLERDEDYGDQCGERPDRSED